ncbi:MAG TPA: glycosyltransferase family 87 protein [Patescibacteria group bacterium]|nr:glycosyltransferase family 87 protein [Patescibacteria group bacterium]
MAGALVVVSVLALLFTLNFIASHRVITPDFLSFYSAGSILRRGESASLYDLSLQRRIELQTFPHASVFLPFYHPAFEAPLFVPFAYTSFDHAFALWGMLNLGTLALLFWLLPRTGYRLDDDSRLVWLAGSLVPVAETLLLGQDSLVLVLLVVLAFLALKRRRDFAAGMALGAGLFRFQFLLPFAFIFVLRRRWRLLGGIAMAGTLAVAVSAALVGWVGLLNYVKLIFSMGQLSGREGRGIFAFSMPSLRGAIATFGAGWMPRWSQFPVVLLGSLILLVWSARRFRHIALPEARAFDLEFCLVSLAALLASYQLYVHGLDILLLVGFVILGHECASRREGSLRDRAGTALILLLAATLVIGFAFGFSGYSVLFTVLLGLMIWLSQEIAAAPAQTPGATCTGPK